MLQFYFQLGRASFFSLSFSAVKEMLLRVGFKLICLVLPTAKLQALCSSIFFFLYFCFIFFFSLLTFSLKFFYFFSFLSFRTYFSYFSFSWSILNNILHFTTQTTVCQNCLFYLDSNISKIIHFQSFKYLFIFFFLNLRQIENVCWTRSSGRNPAK